MEAAVFRKNGGRANNGRRSSIIRKGPWTMKRIVAGLLTLAILVGGLVGCAREPAPEGTLTVTVLDVGKADCILIQ